MNEVLGMVAFSSFFASGRLSLGYAGPKADARATLEEWASGLNAKDLERLLSKQRWTELPPTAVIPA